jgi:hypothetical protein
MSAKRLPRGAKALRGSYEAASHLREAIREHNIEFSCAAESDPENHSGRNPFVTDGT